MAKPLFLSYAACGTCKKALGWLAGRGIEVDVRPIVDDPPRPKELDVWMPASGLPAKKWLNTSGQSYRDLGGKATFEGAADDRIAAFLAGDGKLVKRPVLVDGDRVLVGFDEAAYAAHFAGAKARPSAAQKSTATQSAAKPKKPAPARSASKRA
jgi:arsenate reductase